MPDASISRKTNLTLIGGGYVGLVTGACFASWGVNVAIFERDSQKRALLQSGVVPIHEPDLAELITAPNLSFPNDLKSALAESACVMIAVGTPQAPDGQADLSALFAAIDQVAQNLPDLENDAPFLIIVKSTVPVGTGREIERRLNRIKPKRKFTVVSNPEFLREGRAVSDFCNPDRVIVGLPEHVPHDTEIRGIFSDLYASVYEKNPDTLVYMNRESAELTKYASNAFLALKVGYINEIADLCEHLGASADQVALGMGLDPRIGGQFLSPGPGVGGSCFPKDTKALASTARQAGVEFNILNAAIESNERRTRSLGDKIRRLSGAPLSDKTIAILGLTFKADTDDMRDAPALTLIPDLIGQGAKIRAFDPRGMENARDALAEFESSIIWCADARDTLQNADYAVILTEWGEFKTLRGTEIAKLMRGRNLFDFRNLLNGDDMERAGLLYYGVGKAKTGDLRHGRN